MKLWELSKGAKLKLVTIRGEEIVTFQHTDGMYSLITADRDGEIMHLAVWTPMKKVGNYYEIDEDNNYSLEDDDKEGNYVM